MAAPSALGPRPPASGPRPDRLAPRQPRRRPSLRAGAGALLVLAGSERPSPRTTPRCPVARSVVGRSPLGSPREKARLEALRLRYCPPRSRDWWPARASVIHDLFCTHTSLSRLRERAARPSKSRPASMYDGREGERGVGEGEKKRKAGRVGKLGDQSDLSAQKRSIRCRASTGFTVGGRGGGG